MKPTSRETEKQRLSLEKLTTLPSTQDYVSNIYSLNSDLQDGANKDFSQFLDEKIVELGKL